MSQHMTAPAGPSGGFVAGGAFGAASFGAGGPGIGSTAEISQAFESIYSAKIGQQNVVCDRVPPIPKKLANENISGTWY